MNITTLQKSAFFQKVAPKYNKDRWHWLDTLRGIVLISMIVFHTCWDLAYIFGVNLSWYNNPFKYIWQQSICITFILISGYCINLGKNTIKRGLTVFICGIIITVITLVFMPEQPVIYGILTLLGSCMLIMIPLKKPFSKINPYLGGAVSLLLFIFTRNISLGYLGFFGLFKIYLPKVLYSGYISTYFGFLSSDFFSTDYFALFPWIFMFFCGFFLYHIWHPSKDKPFLPFIKSNPFSFIGRHSLIIYMLHQPIVYLILTIIFSFIK